MAKLGRRIAAVAIFALCAFLVVASVIGLCAHLSRPHQHDAAVNLKHLSIAMQLYASDHNGLYPPVSSQPYVLALDLAAMYPDYLNDLSVLDNPLSGDTSTKDFVDTQSVEKGLLSAEQMMAANYTSLGWAVRNEDELQAVLRHLEETDWADRDSDVITERGTVFRLRKGAKSDFAGDARDPEHRKLAAATIPLMFESVHEWDPSQVIQVLYLDGHVEFVRLGRRFPATERTCVWLLKEREQAAQ